MRVFAFRSYDNGTGGRCYLNGTNTLAKRQLAKVAPAGGGGIENLNTAPATIDEMLLQPFQGKIRPFVKWPMGTDARFGDLRAFGAFLVLTRRYWTT